MERRGEASDGYPEMLLQWIDPPVRVPWLRRGETNGIRWGICQAGVLTSLNGYVRLPKGVDIDVDSIPAPGPWCQITDRWWGYDTMNPMRDRWDLDHIEAAGGVMFDEVRENSQYLERLFDKMPGLGSELFRDRREWDIDVFEDVLQAVCTMIAIEIGETGQHHN